MTPPVDAAPEGVPGSTADRLETLFERQVRATPDAIAMMYRDTTVRYDELEAYANRIAHRLRALSVGPEKLVGLCLDRSIDLIAAMLGILKAGGAYLPLDPAYPPARLKYMLDDSGASVLIARGGLPAGLDYSGKILDLDQAAASIATLPATPPVRMGDAKSLAYVIYTSGSTGQPKGVMLEHTAVNMMRWAANEFPDGQLARVAAASSICFDPSVFEIFAPLSTGGMVLLKDSPIDRFGPDERPTMLNTVPSVLAEMVATGAIPESVRVVNIGGEKLSISLVHAIYRTSNVERVYNHYGPTEATTCTSVALVAQTDTEDPPIGRPICNAEFRILDAQGREVTGAQDGEIHIAGPMLARGYMNAPDITAERFLPDPSAPGHRLYKTGDIGRWGSDGNVEFIGRTGDLVKLHGFRIAPGEIESRLLKLPGVRQAAVSVAKDEQDRDRLVAYVAGDSLDKLRLGKVRQVLKTWLPHYMLPSWLEIHEALPLTLSGKIDRNALPPVRWEKAGSAGTQDFLMIARAAADVMASELGLSDVGLDDDFFELGGDSIRAVNVSVQLETALGRRVSPALFAHASTPRLLHEALENEKQESDSHLTVLQGAGQLPPIFCLPDIYGRALSFITLANEFAPDQPLYGLAIGPIADAFIANPSMEMLLEAYIATVRTQQPKGPYRIAGYSFGGPFAQELARQLHEQGDDVSLVLIDAPNRGSRYSARTSGKWARMAWNAAKSRHGPAEAIRRAYSLRHSLLGYVLKRERKNLPAWLPDADQPLAQALLQVEREHQPKPFHGRTLNIMCRRQANVNTFINMDGMLGWRDVLKGPVEIYVADVRHYEIVRNPHAALVASRLREFFDARELDRDPRVRTADSIMPVSERRASLK